jgi:hypothetical protein
VVLPDYYYLLSYCCCPQTAALDQRGQGSCCLVLQILRQVLPNSLERSCHLVITITTAAVAKPIILVINSEVDVDQG